jgi:hypothetical protein
MITFILGIAFGSLAGMFIMALFVAGKREEAVRDSLFCDTP